MMNLKMKVRRLAAAVCSVCVSAALLSVQVFAEGESSADAASNAPSAGVQMLASILPFILALLAIYFIMMRPQQKREKEAQEMRDNVRIGDEVCTAGGIVGIVLRITEDTVVLETGGERSKIRVKKWAIHENITQMEEKQAAEKERKAAKLKGVAVAGAVSDDTGKKKKNTDQ